MDHSESIIIIKKEEQESINLLREKTLSKENKMDSKSLIKYLCFNGKEDSLLYYSIEREEARFLFTSISSFSF